MIAPARTPEPRPWADSAPAWLIPPICALCLIWPALWNSYPIVFADTGTYLSQAPHRYLGWSRPVFYSLFIWPLHLQLTTWPVILAQAALTVLVLDLTRIALGAPRSWLLPLIAFLAAGSWLPWIVSELQPDLCTPLLVLVLSLLAVAGPRQSSAARVALTVLAACLTVTQQSSVPLALGSSGVMLLFARLWSGLSPLRIAAPLLAATAAIAAIATMNAAGFGRASLAPYGNVFLLARVIYDGPGMDVLRRDCPDHTWRLCPFVDRMPASSDDFLWRADSPVLLAGGHKAVSAEADEIIRAAIASEPWPLARAFLANTLRQLRMFESGDGLNSWDAEAGSWIRRDFPSRESAAFAAGRQENDRLTVPPWLATVHRAVALGGIAAAALLLPLAFHRKHAAGWFLLMALLTLPLGAAITGGLSGPHDRYQSRIVWLPAAVAFLSVPALARRRPVAAASGGQAAAIGHP